MIYNGEEVEFPAIMQVSFFKLIEQLEEQAKDSDSGTAEYAKELLKEVEKYPELKTGISDVSKLPKYQKSIDKLARPLFPEVLTTNEIKLLTPPFYFDPIYTSERFKTIIEASGEPFEFFMKDVDKDTFYLYCCYFILGSYFGYSVGATTPQLIEIFNRNQGIMRVYKLLINADMSEFIPTDKAVHITREDYEQLMNNFDKMELWKEKFPPNSWIMRGLNIVNLVDVTTDQSISSITSNLLVKTADSFKKITDEIRRLLNNASLDIGVLSLEGKKLAPYTHTELTSIIMEKDDFLDCGVDLCEFSLCQLLEKKEPLVVTDTEVFQALGKSEMANKLINAGFQSYIIIPIVHEDELLGFLEMGSKNKYELHDGILEVLGEVVPILAMAKKRFKTEAQNLVEAIIQQECTTIHPSVKWRFEEEAELFMTEQAAGGQPVFKDIIFNNLYPLYGQLDIKGSSERRNKAVSLDLLKQIKGASNVLKSALKNNNMPAFEELLFRLEAFARELKEELAAGSEHRILSFLKEDVYPVFDYLKGDADFAKSVEKYYAMLDSEVQSVYEARKKYDTSVNLINQRLASYLDDKQVKAQEMFPHYFERYKTDGVEFNMYIGESIAKNENFNLIHLRNLRIWQLMVMCEMENEFQAMQEELDAEIEIASLILVYNTSLAVHFRMDEKQFDVEGAYNARYEIIKKRVDKAHIKGTNERITKPGNIVIVYSQERDANEYRTYLKFLMSKGYLKEHIEDLVLEDLQGVHGLRALRVEVDYSSQQAVDELIKEFEGQR